MRGGINPPRVALAIGAEFAKHGIHGKGSWAEFNPFHQKIVEQGGQRFWHHFKYTFSRAYKLPQIPALAELMVRRARRSYRGRAVLHALLGTYGFDDANRPVARITRLHAGEWRAVAAAQQIDQLQGEIHFVIDDWNERYKEDYLLHGLALDVRTPFFWHGWPFEEERVLKLWKKSGGKYARL